MDDHDGEVEGLNYETNKFKELRIILLRIEARKLIMRYRKIFRIPIDQLGLNLNIGVFLNPCCFSRFALHLTVSTVPGEKYRIPLIPQPLSPTILSLASG